MGNYSLDNNIGDPDDCKFLPDAVWTAQALPNATDLSSSVVQLARVQGALEFVLEADEDTTVADGATLTLSVIHDNSSAGPFSATKVVARYAPSGSDQTFDAGDKIFRYVPDQDIDPYCILVVTSSADQSGTKATGWLNRVSR